MRTEMQRFESHTRGFARRYGYRLERTAKEPAPNYHKATGFYRLVDCDSGHEVEGSAAMTLREVDVFIGEQQVRQRMREVFGELDDLREFLQGDRAMSAEQVAKVEAEEMAAAKREREAELEAVG